MSAGLGGLPRCKTWQGSPHCLRFSLRELFQLRLASHPNPHLIRLTPEY